MSRRPADASNLDMSLSFRPYAPVIWRCLMRHGLARDPAHHLSAQACRGTAAPARGWRAAALAVRAR